MSGKYVQPKILIKFRTIRKESRRKVRKKRRFERIYSGLIEIRKTFMKGFTASSVENKRNGKKKNGAQIKFIQSERLEIGMNPNLDNLDRTIAQVKTRGHQLAHSPIQICKH